MITKEDVRSYFRPNLKNALVMIVTFTTVTFLFAILENDITPSSLIIRFLMCTSIFFFFIATGRLLTMNKTNTTSEALS